MYVASQNNFFRKKPVCASKMADDFDNYGEPNNGSGDVKTDEDDR